MPLMYMKRFRKDTEDAALVNHQYRNVFRTSSYKIYSMTYLLKLLKVSKDVQVLPQTFLVLLY